MNLRTIDSKTLHGIRVLLRVEVNVPHTPEGWPVEPSARLRTAARTLALYSQAGARTVVLAHRGEPKGVEMSLSTERVAQLVMQQAHLGERGHFLPAMPFEQVRAHAQAMAPGDVLWLENVRFDPREYQNDSSFAEQLAALGDLFINDAFGVLHRKQASVHAVAKILPSYAGPTVVAECAALDRVRVKSERPCVAVVGGGKLSTKIRLLERLFDQADTIFLGTGLAALFVVASGGTVGKTPAPAEEVALAKKWLGHPAIRLPHEILFKNEDNSTQIGTWKTMPANAVLVDWTQTMIASLQTELTGAKTVFWNGPVGVVEDSVSRVGTDAVAQAIAAVGRTPRTYAVAGGGETVEAIEALGLGDFFDWVSTGGGAMLAYIGGESMPGLEVLGEGK